MNNKKPIPGHVVLSLRNVLIINTSTATKSTLDKIVSRIFVFGFTQLGVCINRINEYPYHRIFNSHLTPD